MLAEFLAKCAAVEGRNSAIFCASADLIYRSMPDFGIHLTADIISEADSLLSRTRAEARAGASHS
jgi:hypothetical protein